MLVIFLKNKIKLIIKIFKFLRKNVHSCMDRTVDNQIRQTGLNCGRHELFSNVIFPNVKIPNRVTFTRKNPESRI